MKTRVCLVGRWAALLLGLIPATVPLSGQSGAKNGEWRSHSGDLGATKYSPLDQITKDNVRNLRIVWRWKADNLGPRPDINFQATPLMIGGVLYTTAGSRRDVVAIDGATGETLWMYRIDEGERALKSSRRTSGRGVAYWTDGRGDERIYSVTAGYRLVALNAKSGIPVAGFGENGIVDLKQGLDRVIDPVNDDLSLNSGPLVANNVIVVGAAGAPGSVPATKEHAPGFVRGYDVRTGKRLWIFHTIPLPGEPGNETWENDSWSYTGNAGAWAPLSADEELGRVYLPLEEATGDYYGGTRPGKNLFSTSLVCLDIKTGKLIWYYQFVHHDIWDRDVMAPPILVDITVGGKNIKAVAQLTKHSWVWVFDRVTGAPVWPIVERPVPKGNVPGEWYSPTQPFPTKPAPFDRQGISSDDLIDFTPELKAEARKIISQYRTGGLYEPPSLLTDPTGTKGTIMLPSSTGGPNWPGGAIDVETDVLYVHSKAVASYVLGMVHDPKRSNMDYIRETAGDQSVQGPQGLPLIKPPWGRITAINLNTGEHVWMVPNGETPENVRSHPALKGITIPKTGRPGQIGVFVTKTLLFAGEAGPLVTIPAGTGSMFRAYDKKTGGIIAEILLPANTTGVPMTYMLNGRQYVVVAVGAPNIPAELVALALP